MDPSKPRLALVCSPNISHSTSYYAQALKDFLTDTFDVTIIDLKSLLLLRQPGGSFFQKSEEHIDEICCRLQSFDLVNIHCDLSLYGVQIEHSVSRILKLCQASKRLILTFHRLEAKDTSANVRAYTTIINNLKERPSSNPFHVLVHLPRDRILLEKIYHIKSVTDFPVLFLTDERRTHFQQQQNQSLWKEQFGLKKEDITIGLFGFLSAYKNYPHALRTLKLLPPHYKLLITGEVSSLTLKEWQLDAAIKEMTAYLDDHPQLAQRVIFTGYREAEKFNDDLANVDFVLLPHFEVGQSASATLSHALELGCAVLMSNTHNAREYEAYFTHCFEVFDIGNYYETKHKILHFDKTKLVNLKKRLELYSETQVRQIYSTLYEAMKSCIPVELPLQAPLNTPQPVIEPPSPSLIRTVFHHLPSPAQSLLRKIKRKLMSAN